jgi:membrane associated rhomboid family serine protease
MARGIPVRRAMTFGGRVPPGLGGIFIALIAGMLAAQLVPSAASWLVLVPGLVLQGELWRLVTWPFVNGLLDLVFVALTLWWIGQTLAYEWSDRGFVVRFLEIVVGAALVTTVVALAWPPLRGAVFAGAWPATWALLFTWGLLHPGAQISWFGVLPMTGKTIAQVVVFGTILWAIANGGLHGFPRYAPNLAAIAIAYGALRGRGGTRRGWLRLKRRWYEWRLERRSRHLKVVGRKDGEDGDRPRWMN